MTPVKQRQHDFTILEEENALHRLLDAGYKTHFPGEEINATIMGSLWCDTPIQSNHSDHMLHYVVYVVRSSIDIIVSLFLRMDVACPFFNNTNTASGQMAS